MAIVIKKRVDLDFLGEEYNSAYLIFQSIPANDFDEAIRESKATAEKGKGSVKFILDILKKYFLSGEFPNEGGVLAKVEVEDLGDLDANTLTTCFGIFAGTNDPKVETPLQNSSPTAEIPQENS